MTATRLIVPLVALLSSAVLAQADYITGIAWDVPQTTAVLTPTLGNQPGAGATEIATFTASAINFTATYNYNVGFTGAPGTYTLAGFLNSNGAASNITYLNYASPVLFLNNTLWEFTGSALFTNGETYSVTHDDGVNLYVNGIAVLLDGDATEPVVNSFTYTGPMGVFNFDFLYSQCCLGTADFVTDLVPDLTSAPEPAPASLLLAAALLAGGFYKARRRFFK